jgi:hypothetical protein
LQLGYNQKSWFKNELNLQPLLKHEGLWWKDDKLVIPDRVSIKEKIVHLCLNAIYGGRIGRNNTYDLVARSYWWPGAADHAFIHCFVSS